MELMNWNEDPRMLMKNNTLNVIGEGLRAVTGIIAQIQKQKTSRAAIRTAGEITIEQIRSQLVYNLNALQTDCNNRENTLNAFSLLMASKSSITTEELDMALNFLLKVGLSRLDHSLPDIDQVLRLISSPLQGEGEKLE
jgi:hypothetical protein